MLSGAKAIVTGGSIDTENKRRISFRMGKAYGQAAAAVVTPAPTPVENKDRQQKEDIRT